MVTGPGQSTPARPATAKAPRARLLLESAALAVLLLVPALHLGRRELTPAEGRYAQASLGALEHDRRGAVDDGAAALLRGWSLVVGTTERPLRLLSVLAFLVAALIAGEVAMRLDGRRARVLAWLAVAASPLLARDDLLHPGLPAALPAALALASLVALRGGSWPWWIASLVASLAAPFLGAPALLAVLAVTWLAILLEERAAPGRRGLFALLSACALVPGVIMLAFRARLEIPQSWSGDPGLLDLLSPGGATLPYRAGVLLLAGVLLFGLLRTPGRRRLEASLLAALLTASVILVVLPGSGFEILDSSWAAVFLPLVSLLVGLSASALPRWGATLAVLGFAACALLPLHAAWPAAAPERVHADADPGPMRAALREARELSRSGGRLVVAGPERYGILFYSRRGHDPGVPLVALPDDVSAADLATWLRERLGRNAPGSTPTLLLYPATTDPMPGLEILPIPGSESGLVQLRFTATREPRSPAPGTNR